MKPSAIKALFLKQNLQPGEVYAGIILGKNNEPDHHVFLLPGYTSSPWDAAKAWADKIGGMLPTRREQSLLFANCKDEFQGDWYWSSEQHASDASYAWFQLFGRGGQGRLHTAYTLRARAVRRLIIQ